MSFNTPSANIGGLITQGTNVTITGTGVTGDPYNISASGGGSAPIYTSQQIPFGDGSTAGGITSANLTWNDTDKVFTAGGTNTNFVVDDDSNNIVNNTNGSFLVRETSNASHLLMYANFGSNLVQLGDVNTQVNGTTFTLDDAAQTYTFNKLGGGGTQYVTVDNSGVMGVTTVTNPSLTATQIGFGDGSNLLTGSTNLLWNDSTLNFSVGDLANSVNGVKFLLTDSTHKCTVKGLYNSLDSTLMEINSNLGSFAFGDIDGSQNGARIKVTDSLSEFLFRDNNGRYIQVDPSIQSFGDINTVGNGTYMYLDNSGKTLNLRANGNFATFDLNLLTTNRTYSYPDGSGTIALKETSPYVSAKVNLTAQAADISATTLANAGAGLYRLSYYLLDSTADLTAGAVTATFTYTDASGSQTVTSSSVLLTTLGAKAQETVFLQYASGNIQYAVSHTGIFGTATYNLYITLEKVG